MTSWLDGGAAANTMPCKAESHEKVLDLHLETFLNTLSTWIPLIWVWLLLGVDHSMRTLLRVPVILSLSSLCLLLVEET